MYEVPKIWGMLGPRPLEMGAWLIRKNTFLLHMCYHTKFGRSKSNHMGVSKGDQN